MKGKRIASKRIEVKETVTQFLYDYYYLTKKQPCFPISLTDTVISTPYSKQANTSGAFTCLFIVPTTVPIGFAIKDKIIWVRRGVTIRVDGAVLFLNDTDSHWELQVLRIGSPRDAWGT